VFTAVWFESCAKRAQHSCGSSNMVTHLENWSRLELQRLVSCLRERRVSAADIHRQPMKVYGNGVIPRQHFVMRCHTYASVRVNVTDDKRSGSRSSSQPEVNTARALDTSHMDRRVTLWLMVFDLALSSSSMRHIVVAVLGCSHTESYLHYDCNTMIR